MSIIITVSTEIITVSTEEEILNASSHDGKFRSRLNTRCPTCYIIKRIEINEYNQKCKFCQSVFRLELEYKEISIEELDWNEPILCASCKLPIQCDKIFPGACPRCGNNFGITPKLSIIVSPPLRKSADE